MSAGIATAAGAQIDYIPAHMLGAYPSVFKPRTPLKPTAQRHGWQGYF